MTFDLTGRVALITGAASGIGAATARVYAAAGADLALAWYPPDGYDIEPVRHAAEKAGRRVVVEAVDVTQSAQVDSLVSRAARELGGLHIVVANAGIARRVPLQDLDDANWNKVLDVNLNGVWRCFRAALPHMQKARFGRLIATSSVAGTVSAWPQHSHYTAAKAGLVGLVKSLAVEFGSYGITANAVAPGVIRTPQALDPVNSLGPDAIEAVADKIPAGRIGTPEDIAYVFQFLASAEASYVNGQLLVVDGAPELGEPLVKIAGLIGGMSWESTIPYYRQINEYIKERLGGLHSAKIILYSVDFHEIERLQHAGDWETAGRSLADTARRVEGAGADFLVLCTNTMHKVAAAIEAAVRIPLLHIADPTAADIKAEGFSTVGLLGTRFTMEESFYKNRLEERQGLRTVIPTSDDCQIVHRIIFEELCLGQLRDESRNEYRRIIRSLVDRGAQAVILGCTEISLLIEQRDSAVPLFDTTRIHARKAGEWALA